MRFLEPSSRGKLFFAVRSGFHFFTLMAAKQEGSTRNKNCTHLNNPWQPGFTMSCRLQNEKKNRKIHNS